ncbi:MAG TPA: hypothetical protein VF377_10515 [Acidimicrobiia bacterium]
MIVADVRARLAKKIRDRVEALNTSGDLDVKVNVSDYVLTNPTGIFIQVFPGAANHNNAFQRGHEQRDFIIQLGAPLTSDIGAQKAIDALISKQVIPTALDVKADDDPWDDINLDSDTGYTRFEKDGSAPLLGVEFTVRVYG